MIEQRHGKAERILARNEKERDRKHLVLECKGAGQLGD